MVQLLVWTHSELPGTVSACPIVPAQTQATWELPDGAWELKMRPQFEIPGSDFKF